MSKSSIQRQNCDMCIWLFKMQNQKTKGDLEIKLSIIILCVIYKIEIWQDAILLEMFADIILLCIRF